jgi:predicted Zn-ribbon and HTH transcriptional regulator
LEKSPATPGPILPAREQLGDLLLEQHHPSEAAIAFRQALVDAPNRRGALQGLTQASQSLSKNNGEPIRCPVCKALPIIEVSF